MEEKTKISQLIKEIITDKKYFVNVSKIAEKDLAELLSMCSSKAFNLLFMMKDGNIGVITDINDPRNIELDDENIVSYSNIFIMNDSIMGVGKDIMQMSKLLDVIKMAFKNKEKGFSVTKM